MELVQGCCQICKKQINLGCQEALNFATSEINFKCIKWNKLSGDKLTIEDSKAEEEQNISGPSLHDCVRCKRMIKEIKNILHNAEELERNEIIGICDHCQKINTTSHCKRCSLLNRKYEKQNSETIKKCNYVLNKINLLLEDLESHKCIRSINFFPYAIEELQERFTSMKMSLTNQIPIKELLDSDNLNTRELDPLRVTHAKTKMKAGESVLSVQKERQSIDKITAKANLPRTDLLGNSSSLHISLSNTIGSSQNLKRALDSKSFQTEKVPKSLKKSTKTGRDIASAENMPMTKHKYDKSSELFRKMILQQKKSRKQPEIMYKSQRMLMADLEQLRPLPIREIKEVPSEQSTSILECENLATRKLSEHAEFIKGTKICSGDLSFKQSNRRPAISPLLHEIHHNFENSISKTSYDTVLYTSRSKDLKPIKTKNAENMKNQTSYKEKYQLSDSKYIDNGWTVLPTYKTLRRMHIYNTISSHPEYDWFENNKYKKYTRYDSGEKLSQTTDDGEVRWYYRDGGLALKCFNAREKNSNHKYLIYDPMNSKKVNKKDKRDIILACFDKVGHGVVYDRDGQIRLKYNQSEGVIFDENAAPKRWKWNTLNDPPALQRVLEEKSFKSSDDCLKNIFQKTLENSIDSHLNAFDKEMYTIELQNAVREKSKNVSMNYKPFEIRYKYLKLNDYFTLKIFDQTKIYLQFSDREVSFKFNLGLKLISNEIIGTEVGDIDDVVTPYDIKAEAGQQS